MTSGRNWLYEAGRVWSMLVSVAKQPPALLVYEDIAKAISTNPLSVRYALDPIQNFCLAERLPPLTVLVVQKSSGKPGTGFIAWDVDDLSSAYQRVRAFDWTVIANPFANLGSTDTIDSLATQLVLRPAERAQIYAKVPSRGIAQQVFRAALLKAYKSQCAFCGLSFEDALEAAHIWPWKSSSPEERLDPANGVLACATHHRLFDAHLMTFDSAYRIVYYDARMMEGPYTDADGVASCALHRKKLRLPSHEALRPNRDLLDRRNVAAEWGELSEY